MEELCKLICGKIYSSTREGYGIFYEDELLDILPEDNRTREVLEAVLKQLVNGGNIEVKYAKGNAFCILGLKNYAERTAPSSPAAPAASECRGKSFKEVALPVAAAFGGGILGGIIAGLITYAF